MAARSRAGSIRPRSARAGPAADRGGRAGGGDDRPPRRRPRHAGDLRQGLSPAEIAARFADRGLVAAGRTRRCSACWPLNEERGERAADASPHGRHATHHQPRDLDDRRARLRRRRPAVRDLRSREGPPSRPRPAAGFRRSLRLPLEGDARVPAARERSLGDLRRPNPLPARRRRTTVSHRVHRSKKAAARPKAPIAFLCSTNTWRAYAATPFSPTWNGIKKSIGNNGFANSPGDPPAFCFYRPHHAGQGTYQIGLPDALADRRPVHAHGPGGMGLQPPLPAGSVHAGLAGNPGVRLRRPERHRPASRSATSSTATRCSSSSGTANTGRSRR